MERLPLDLESHVCSSGLINHFFHVSWELIDSLSLLVLDENYGVVEPPGNVNYFYIIQWGNHFWQLLIFYVTVTQLPVISSSKCKKLPLIWQGYRMIASTCYLGNAYFLRYILHVINGHGFFLLRNMLMLVPSFVNKRDHQKISNLLGHKQSLASCLNSKLPFIVPSKCKYVSIIPFKDCMVVPASCLHDEFVLKMFDKGRLVSRLGVVKSKLSVIIETAGEDFALSSHKDWVVQATGYLHYLSCWKAPDNLRRYFMADVLLSQLPVVVSPSAVDEGVNVVTSLLDVLHHYQWVVVAAGDISYKAFSEGVDLSWRRQVRLGTVP